MCQESTGSCKTHSSTKHEASTSRPANATGGTQTHTMEYNKRKSGNSHTAKKCRLGGTPQVPIVVDAANTIPHILQSPIANQDTQQQLTAEPVLTSTCLTLLAQHQ